MTDVRRLPGPIVELWDWQLQAACRGMGGEVFFHPDAERGPSKMRRDAAAKAICHSCPVMDSCARHALAVREPYGVWGGLTVEERDEILSGRRALPATAC
jgi:WhiB family transcriptional regulator, redox-sensing transcriptional regulator